MEELTLTTPALLFSAVSLILLAYTNRFLSYAQLVRQLRDRYMENPTDITVAQIENLRKRLNLTRTMQGLGIASLFLCVVSMFFIYIGLQLLSAYVFGVALLLLIASLGVSFREIQISTRSLEIYLGAMEKRQKKAVRKHFPTALIIYIFKIFSIHHQRCPNCESTKKIPASPTFLSLSTIPCAVASSSTCSRTNPHRKS